jgi:formylglycine-generating enzyme required for sulfatase activity
MSGAGISNCGPSGNESCCTSLEVTGGGPFYRTYFWNTPAGPQQEADPATISGFRLDKYPVTVGRYRQFVAAWNNPPAYKPPAGSGKHTHLNGGQGLVNVDSGGPAYEPGWQTSDNGYIYPASPCATQYAAYATWTSAAGNNENLPINCVNWQEAYAFCIWDGGFLPSNAELEYVMAAGTQQREYAWGETPPGTNNQYTIAGCYYPNPAASGGTYMSCTGFSNIAPVGSAPLGLGLWGQLDLTGEISVWVLDWYSMTLGNPCTDCAFLTQPTTNQWRDFRGSSFDTALNSLPTYGTTGAATPSYPPYETGIRCARTP